jgi:hypothetical protein
MSRAARRILDRLAGSAFDTDGRTADEDVDEVCRIADESFAEFEEG